ncbi:hypothetical protein D3C72_1114060 [compost metagenome]
MASTGGIKGGLTVSPARAFLLATAHAVRVARAHPRVAHAERLALWRHDIPITRRSYREDIPVAHLAELAQRHPEAATRLRGLCDLSTRIESPYSFKGYGVSQCKFWEFLSISGKVAILKLSGECYGD